MGSVFKPKMPPLPPVQPPPPMPEPEISAEEKERLAQERAAVERKRRGRKSTILTGSLTPEAEAAAKAEKTLLGDA
jgi:hypothetical protein